MREGVDGLKRLKLLHCGDLHLDVPFTSLADKDGKPEQRRQELRRTLIGIVDLALSERVDLLLVCGDLYEHGYVRKNTFHFICEQFRRIRDVPVLLIPGNHDPLSPDSFYSRFEWPENVRILKDSTDYFDYVPTCTRVYCHIPTMTDAPVDMALSGAGMSGGITMPGVGEPDPSGRLEGAWINILMLHGTLDMPFSKDAYQPVTSMELDSSGFDYFALGHFHSMIRGAGRSKRIYNAGSPEPLGFDEEGDHGVFIVTIEKPDDRESQVDVAFRKLCKRHFIHLDVQVGGCSSDEETASAVLSSMESAGSAEDLYRISLQGRVNRSYRADTAYIPELLKENAFYIKIIDNTAPDYDFKMLATEPGLRGLFVRKMLERVERASDEEEHKLVMQALYYGLEAIDEGSVCV